MSPSSSHATVEIEGRTLKLSNLDKPLYPDGFTKSDLLEYYARVAPVLLPHLRRRPVTIRRFPDGTESAGFISKNVPRHAPDWVRTVVLPRKGTGWGASKKDGGSSTTEYMLVEDLATLTWLANLAVVELHSPMWRVGRDGTPRPPDMIVFDLDPGPSVGMAECCRVAALLRERLGEEGIELLAKTSGSKGLQCYGSIASRRWPPGRSNDFAHEVAEQIERAEPRLVVSRMAKELRPGKVLIDWSQNNVAKTTVTVYSLRAKSEPAVSTPVEWDEVTACASGEQSALSFGPAEVLERVARLGDLFGPLLG